MTTTERIRILGIDPGLTITGLAIIDCENGGFSCAYTQSIKTNVEDQIPTRLTTIFKMIERVIAEHGPKISAIESGLVNTSATSSMKLAYGFAAAVLASTIGMTGVFSYCPKTVKKVITSNGNADKRMIKAAVINILGNDMIPIPSGKKTISDHEYDAIAIAICHFMTVECVCQTTL